MRSDELRAAGAVTGRALGELADVARDVHRAVADRVFTHLGPAAQPVRAVHNGIAAIAYGAACVGVRMVPVLAGAVAGAVHDPSAPSAHDSPRARAVLGAVNGFWGDRLARQQPALAPPLRLRRHDGPLRRLPANLAHDAAAATGRLVIFLPGLCETDRCWSFAAEKRWGDRDVTYGSQLRAEGWTAVYANFNSGLHISANGRELAEHLEQLVTAWPVPVTDVALIGHSLGGLVARSAAHQADELGHTWRTRLRHVIGLGVPHLGAPLERFANRGTHQLARLPETRPIAEWLDRRSVGIKDLRHGAVLEADWLDHDPDDPHDHCTAATLLPGVAYSSVSVTLTGRDDGLLANDLLVQHASAHGVGPLRSIPFDAARGVHVPGRKHHFDLLADPGVYEAIVDNLRVVCG